MVNPIPIAKMKNKWTRILFLAALLLSVCSVRGQKLSSDNGDGTYSNPVIFADFPDPDVIYVDSVYYMVSTSMFIFPGVTILKSCDLVNWEYCANAVDRMDFSECYNLEGCDRYGHGQWATSLKYHDGKFYLMFITLDEGGFLCSADHAGGPWEIRKLPKGFYDPGLFFDDDGRIYVAHGYNQIYITELNEDFSPRGSDSLVFEATIRPGLEGCHVYHIDDYYYLYATYGGPDGFQVALRSHDIYGPYEERIVIRDTVGTNFGVHQGALVQTTTGEWWTILFIDNGPFGRMPTLQPVRWDDGWPVAGINGSDGVDTWPKPDVGRECAISVLPTSDEFESGHLGMQWGWNHNPVPGKWSLTEKPGSLALHTAGIAGDLTMARNTLTQRITGYYSDTIVSTATTKMDASGMKNGDFAGIAVFQDPYACLGVQKEDDQWFLVMVNDGEQVERRRIDEPVIYLKALASNPARKAYFAYSLDNRTFTSFGNMLEMKFSLSVFTGNKFCLFNYATKETGGTVYFDWFRTAPE